MTAVGVKPTAVSLDLRDYTRVIADWLDHEFDAGAAHYSMGRIYRDRAMLMGNAGMASIGVAQIWDGPFKIDGIEIGPSVLVRIGKRGTYTTADVEDAIRTAIHVIVMAGTCDMRTGKEKNNG